MHLGRCIFIQDIGDTSFITGKMISNNKLALSTLKLTIQEPPKFVKCCIIATFIYKLIN